MASSGRPALARPRSTRSRPKRKYSTPADAAKSVVSASSPASRSSIGPLTPIAIGTSSVAGWVIAISSSEKWVPARVTVSPASRRRIEPTLSRSAATGLAGMKPICRSHSGRPRPMPGRKRPGNARLIPAISMASTAGWRTMPETMLVPTGTDSVAPRARVAQTSAGS